jgi:hypothetical protein
VFFYGIIRTRARDFGRTGQVFRFDSYDLDIKAYVKWLSDYSERRMRHGQLFAFVDRRLFFS